MRTLRNLPAVDVMIRTRKASLAYKAQLLKVSIEADNARTILVYTKNPAKLMTDLQVITGERYFTIKVREKLYYVLKLGIKCDLK